MHESKRSDLRSQMPDVVFTTSVPLLRQAVTKFHETRMSLTEPLGFIERALEGCKPNTELCNFCPLLDIWTARDDQLPLE